MNKHIWIVNGPNLNWLGKRETALYGMLSMEQIMLDIQRRYPDICFTYYQSNHEGDLIDRLQEPLEQQTRGLDNIAGIVLNAGGYSHTSVAMRDAVAMCPVPVVEIHITDISQRESFRHVSLLTGVCAHSIIGHGTDGYHEAVEWLLSNRKP